MKISYNWLQNYFEEKLPEPNVLADLITFFFAEVESVETVGKDMVLDIKVLPDRACYALSHRGVAYEIAAKTGLKQKVFAWPQPEVAKTRELKIVVEASDLCNRYMARVIEDIHAQSPSWTRDHLEAVGQKSISPIVDGTNLVMFDVGQPLHAFDADKVVGGLTIRRAKKGEKITTLDNRNFELDPEVLVIADDEGPLALAGIKGGKKAEVTSETVNIIIESANFNAANIRRTSERFGLKTDGAKRHENKISPEWTEVGLNDFTAYLFEIDKNIRAGQIIDIDHSDVLQNVRIAVRPRWIREKLGMEISEKEIESILNSLQMHIEKEDDQWTVVPPTFRVDLKTPEDIIEDIGRIAGYEKIPATLPPLSNEALEYPKAFYCEWKIRTLLSQAGFSEIMTSSFSASGDIAIAKPLASDKKYARSSLHENFSKALKMNALNAPLFETDEIKIFEIGRVFPQSGEKTHLAIGYAGPKKKVAEKINEALSILSEKLGVHMPAENNEGIVEINLDRLSEKLPKPAAWDIPSSDRVDKKFEPFSLYPFIVRDIALFVSEDITPESVTAVLKKEGTDLMVKGPTLFDQFVKEGKKSLAFRMVFQSNERTLSDEEVNAIMEKIYSAISEKGWIVR